jgi:hypothetical protein
MVATERIPILVKVRSGLLNPVLALNGIYPSQFLTGAPVIFPANFKNSFLRNQALGARIQPKITNGCDHDPAMCKSSDDHREDIAYFSG